MGLVRFLLGYPLRNPTLFAALLLGLGVLAAGLLEALRVTERSSVKGGLLLLFLLLLGTGGFSYALWLFLQA